METFNCCIFCNTKNNNVVVQENGYNARKCPKCGLVYTSPRPSLSSIKDLYSYDKAHISAKALLEGSIFQRLVAKHHLNLIKPLKRTGNFLMEIGAGSGYFLDEARNKNYIVFAIEPNPILVQHIEEILKIPCVRELKALPENMKFDVIYLRDVLSHFYSPIDEFKEIHNKLNKRGFIVFETGNFGDVERKYYKHCPSFQFPDHLFFFSTRSIAKLLSTSKFRIVNIFGFSILMELRISRILKKILKISNTFGNSNTIQKSQASLIVKLLQNAFWCVIYLIRYKFGKFLPKRGKPQTVVVIAQRV